MDEPKQLILLAKKGDKEAFGRLYTKYFLPVYRYIYLRIGERADSEDLTQEVFIKVYQSLDRFEDLGKEPLNYFFTIARNLCIDYFRKGKELSLEEKQESGWDMADQKDGPEQSAIRQEKQRLVRQAILKLPEVQKEVVIWRLVSDLSYKEISQMLGKNDTAIRQIYSRALKSLEKILKKQI